RDDVPRRRGDALLRPRRRADLRPPLATRRNPAPMKPRNTLLAGLGIAGMLAFPGSAFAHASLQKESPAFRQRLAAPPRQVVLRFDQSVSVLPGSIEVLTLKGRNLAGPAHAITRGLAAPLRQLPDGPYTVRWKAVSNDGHVVSGVYTSGV